MRWSSGHRVKVTPTLFLTREAVVSPRRRALPASGPTALDRNPGPELAPSRRSLQARVSDYLSDLDTAAATLRRLLVEARAAGNLQAEAVIAAKLHQHAREVLALAGGQLEPPPPLDLDKYPPSIRAKLIDAFTEADAWERSRDESHDPGASTAS